MDKFMKDGSLYQSLFTVIGLGTQFLDNILKKEKTDEASIVENLIIKGLKFLKKLIVYRISFNENTSTPFEEVLITKIIGKKQDPLITIIYDLINHKFAKNAAIIATKVIKEFSKFTEIFTPKPPSLVSYLSSSSSTTEQIKKTLFRLENDENDEIRLNILNLISTIMETQKGLAELFFLYEKLGNNNDDESKERYLNK
jgi:hypothetical protein